MDQVKWKINGLYKADAQKVYEEIGEDNVSPEEVLSKAKDKDSELHKCFEWDDSVAAEKFRLQQARLIICNLVVVTPNKEEEPVRVYQISSERNTYQPTRFFLQQPDEYQKLLQRAKEELKALQKRYKMLSELELVFSAIDEL